MGLRIRTNIPSLEVQKNLRESARQVNEQFAKLSSGKRIVKAADDAAGMAIANRLHAHVRGMRMAMRNANDGIGLVQTAEGAMSEVSNIVIRLRELAVQAASDTNGEKEKGMLNLEYQQLLTEVDRIADTTVFNGQKLLAGENDNGLMEFHVGPDAGEQHRITYDTEKSNIKVDNLGIDGTNIMTKEDARDSFELLDEALDNVVGQRAELGSIQSRLQITYANLDTQATNEDQARSMIEDADIAAETAKLASDQVIKSGGIQSLIKSNEIPYQALRLIG